MLHETDFNEPSTSGAAQTDDIIPQCSNPNLSPLIIITRETVRPHRKGQTSKMPNSDLCKRKSCILNNSSEKLIIETEKKPHAKRKEHQYLNFVFKSS